MPEPRRTIYDDFYDKHLIKISDRPVLPTEMNTNNSSLASSVGLGSGVLTPSEIAQAIPEQSIDLSQTTLNTLLANEDMQTSNFVSGSAGWQIKGKGTAEFNDITARGTITATAGRIANWYINTNTLSSGATEAASNVLIDSANSLIRLGPTSGNFINLDGANLRLRSSNYSSGVAGFTVEPTLMEAENLIARGTLRGATFKYDVIAAVGGQIIVANADALASAMTALDASTVTIRGDSTFAANDILLIRAVTALGIQEEYFRVTSAASAPTYSVTRDLAGTFAADTNPIWQAGTSVVKVGTSDGAAAYSGGWLRLLGEGTNSPHYSVFARTGVAYNSNAERVRLGNLNGWQSAFASDTYGIAIGNYSTGQYFTYDDVTGNLIVNGSNLSNQGYFGDGSDGNVTISGDISLARDMYYNNLTINSGKSINSAGYRIFVKNTLTNNGSISRIGGNGGFGGNGGYLAGGTGGTGGAGGVGSDTFYTAGEAGGAGGAGGAGVGANQDGLNGSAGTAGVSKTNCLCGNGAAAPGGGAGGNSDDPNDVGGSGGGGGGGGTSTAATTNPKSFTELILMRDFYPASPVKFNSAGGSGGAGGGGGGGNSQPNGVSGSGGGGGGGGGAGGIMAIVARTIINNGTFSVAGGAGGNGGNGSGGSDTATFAGGTGGGGGGSGGAGGRGGVLLLVYISLTNNGTITIAGGAGGTGGSGGSRGCGTPDYTSCGVNGVAGAAGGSGSDGVLIQLVI